MSHSYRLYFMNPASGHILRFAEFEAPGDEAAIERAARSEGKDPLELWCRHRKVARLEGKDRAVELAAE